MRTARLLTFVSLLTLIFVIPAAAQKTKKPAPRPTPRPTAINPDVAAAKEKVVNQIHNINVFVDIMGPVAIDIEANDKAAAARKLKKEQIDANDLNKRKLLAAIRGLRDGLVALESDFRTKPALAPYLSKIQGIGSLCSQSEDRAIAGQFVSAKDPLRQIATKLNDTLNVMPGPRPAGSSAVAATPARTIPVSAPSKAPSTSQSTMSTGKSAPSVGMTASEVLQSSWGAPANKRTSSTSNGTTEVWTYSGNRAVYFFNGKVSNVVQ